MKSRMLLVIIALVVLASLVVVPAVSASPLPGKYGGDEGGYCSYRVRYGDTLSKIANRYDTSVWHLRNLNRVKNPNCIWAGEWLLVPCGDDYHQKPVNNGCGNHCKNEFKPVWHPADNWGNYGHDN